MGDPKILCLLRYLISNGSLSGVSVLPLLSGKTQSVKRQAKVLQRSILLGLTVEICINAVVHGSNQYTVVINIEGIYITVVSGTDSLGIECINTFLAFIGSELLNFLLIVDLYNDLKNKSNHPEGNKKAFYNALTKEMFEKLDTLCEKLSSAVSKQA